MQRDQLRWTPPVTLGRRPGRLLWRVEFQESELTPIPTHRRTCRVRAFIDGYPYLYVEILFVVDGDMRVAESLTIRPLDATARRPLRQQITSDALRRVQLSRIQEELSTFMTTHAAKARVPRHLMDEFRRRPKAREGKRDLQKYAATLAEYLKRVGVSRTPLKDMATDLGEKEDTLRHRLHRARHELNWLTPSPDGRPGGELTELGRQALGLAEIGD